MRRYAKFGLDAIGLEAQHLYDVALGGDDEYVIFQQLLDFDTKTAIHSIEVARMLAAFAVRGVIDCDANQRLHLPRLGLVHDYGKISAVDVAILNKPGQLNDAERMQILKHPRAGFEAMMALDKQQFAIPVLLHHELQPRSYEHERTRNQLLQEYDISPKELVADDRMVWIQTLLLAVADHYSARYPLSVHQRTYVANGRCYEVSEMSQLVRADFIEAGKVRELGLLGFLDRAITVAQEVAMDSRPLPVPLKSHGIEKNIHHIDT